MNIQIELRNVDIGRKQALIKQINCLIEPGKLILLSGVNGSGKSTLLKSMLNLIPVLTGDIYINKTSIKSYSYIELAAIMAFVGTERIHEDFIQVEELVRFGRYHFASRQNSTISDTAVSEALNQMQIESLRYKYLNEISDGEWQKANIARALAQETPFILMDEPSAFLDYPSRKKLFHDLALICKDKNKTCIVSTHDVEIANLYADQFWHIESKFLKISDFAPKWEN